MMPEEDKAILRAWADGGAPEGEATAPIEVTSEAIVPDLIAGPLEPYTPNFETTADDYRCQFLDHTFEAETFLTASQVTPGTAQVHHVLMYALTGEQLALSVRSVAPHMHLLGWQQQATIHHADGREECLLDIPDWDFDWQQAYMLPQDSGVEVGPGESVEVRCTRDNSAENQPVVDGSLAEPVDVTRGEGTADEMCLLYPGVTEPYTEAPAPDAPACDDDVLATGACAPQLAACEL